MSGAGGGLDPGSIKPPDAVAALRSFPRRWRAALSVVADDPSTDELVRRRAEESSWSVLEHAWYVAELLRRCGEQVAQVRSADRPNLTADDPRRWVDRGGYGDRGLDAALDRIGDQANALAATLAGLAPDDWLRAGELDGTEITILALAQRTVAGAADHLRATERALRAAGDGGD
jgi:hypothetical protein